MDIFLTIFAILISIVALIVSILAWHKSRVIYEIETDVIRQSTGRQDDIYNKTEHINRKLSSGKYTILGFSQRISDNDWEIFLGKIKKDKKDIKNK